MFSRVLVVGLECGRKALRTKGAVAGREDFSKQSFMGAEGLVGGGQERGWGGTLAVKIAGGWGQALLLRQGSTDS